MATILQGTTPSLTIEINPSDFLVSEVEKLEICVWQGNREAKYYGLSDVVTNPDDNSFTIQFTEKETLALCKTSVYWQMRCVIHDGDIYGTNVSAPINVAALKSRKELTEE